MNNYPRKITRGKSLIMIKTDSSGTGLGAINENGGECIQGLDKEAHINFLELKAAFNAITRSCNQLNDYVWKTQLLLRI